MSEYRLRDQKYSEAEYYFFQTIEMAKSDEEYDVELCTTPPSHTEVEYELNMANDPSSIFSWKLVKRRRARRRYTVSHGGSGANSGAPPAPPSTPTSLTPTGGGGVSTALPNISGEDERLDSLLYILDYAPKYKKKLKEQQRTDAELAELFNVVSITASNAHSTSGVQKSKVQPERGVSAKSRVIRKEARDQAPTKIFKIHRNLKEFFGEPDEEDSVSAPEYDTEEEDARLHRLGRIKPRRLLQTKRQRRFARFEHQERMEAMVDIFDEAMSFNDA
ncbi:uncharacterized protein LOC119636928 [Glossina fuscipes]|uniref:Uncharacterized protein LOC119636928 n=2 Tax=Nemorhina TaxID=44051 RepID=A0A9C5YX46_9MUSC|nr:uncharacterized protein LOC119636928 [Glossina fuscipes]KAI9582523.1 hypothetical protein GQX74_009910 [Glossina fuscipes]